MKVITAPEDFYSSIAEPAPLMFLAGSIEMDTADRWQNKVIDSFNGFEKEIVILNPRRKEWDSTWLQSIDNPKFNEQVIWELKGIMNANMLLYYFDPNTKSPVTMLELGLSINNTQVYVCCPKDFWRRGNVEVFCKEIANHKFFEDLGSAIYEIKKDMLEY